MQFQDSSLAAGARHHMLFSVLVRCWPINWLKTVKGVAMARPTKYQKAYAEQARKLCMLGYTDDQLADFFEVAVSTIQKWKLDHPEFSDSIKKGKDISDGEVADSLYQRAMGYVAPDVDIRVINDQIVKTEIQKHYPPDTAAAIFWLKNRQKKTWRDKIDHGIEGADGGPVQVVNYTPADYAAAQAQLEEKLDGLD